MSERTLPFPLKLRALSSQDIPLLLDWENCDEALRTNDALNPLSADFIDRYVSSSSRHILEAGSLGLIIEATSIQASIGHLVFYDYSPIHRRVAVGLFIAENFRRLKAAHEALRQAVAYAFTRLRCEQVYAEVQADNIPPQKLLKSLGFEHTATLPRWSWSGEDYQDLLYFQLWNK